jgi:hypothetical protein
MEKRREDGSEVYPGFVHSVGFGEPWDWWVRKRRESRMTVTQVLSLGVWIF